MTVGADADPGPHLFLVPTETFEAFYSRELRRSVALAYALTGNRGAAEEIAQDAMTAAFRDWDRVRVMDSPVGWLRRTTANLATSFVRRRVAEGRAVIRLGSRREQHPVLPESDEEFWRAVRTLPRRQAQATALRYGLGCSVLEVAEVLGCAEGTAKAHLHAARATLSRRLGLEAGA